MSGTLDSAIRDMIRRYPDEQPQGLAKRISDELNDVEMRRFFADLVVDRCKTVARTEGNMIKNYVLGNRADGRPANWSPKFENRPSAWQEMLDARELVDGEWKRLGECTRIELQGKIDQRRIQVRQLENSIGNYTFLVNLLDRFEVDTADQIPEGEL